MAYTMKEDIANKKNYGSKRSIEKIKYIVVHYTGNDGDTDENNGNYFQNTIVKASAHYFVDDDSVTQSVPDNYVAYSVGGKKYSNCASTGGGKLYGKVTNTNSLSVELCDDVKNGVVYPSAKTIENAIAFVKVKMKQYGIPAANVIRHFDVNGKSCPAYWCGTTEKNKKWLTEFWNRLSNASTNASNASTNTSSSSVYTGNSIVEYLKSIGKASDIVSRKKYAAQYGISGYTGTAAQNLKLLSLMRGGSSSGTTSSAYYPKYTGNSYGVDTVFKAIGVPEKFRGSWSKRKPIANANGISNYKGTATQNAKLIGLAKSGKLKKI